MLWKRKCFWWKLLRDQRRSLCSSKYTSVWHKPPFLCPKKKSQMSALRFLQIAREPAFSSHLWLQFPALTEFPSSALHNFAPSSPGLSSSPKSNHFYKHCTLAEFLLVVFRSWRMGYIFSPTADNWASDTDCPTSGTFSGDFSLAMPYSATARLLSPTLPQEFFPLLPHSVSLSLLLCISRWAEGPESFGIRFQRQMLYMAVFCA